MYSFKEKNAIFRFEEYVCSGIRPPTSQVESKAGDSSLGTTTKAIRRRYSLSPA